METLYNCVCKITSKLTGILGFPDVNEKEFAPKVYDKLIWSPGYKLTLELPKQVKCKRQTHSVMRMVLNVKSDRKGEASCEKYLTFVVLIPRPNGFHRSEFRIYVSYKKDGELVLVSNFDVPIPTMDYFFVLCEGDDLANVAYIKGDLTIISLS